jgi:hypothetical protein
MWARFVSAVERGRLARPGLWGFPVEVMQPAKAKGQEDKLLMYALVPVPGK